MAKSVVHICVILLVGFVGWTGCGGDDETNVGSEAQMVLDDRVLQQYFEQSNITATGPTDSGLYYEIISSGTGGFPTISDTVEIHYVGRFLTGDIFDTSKDNIDEPAKILLGNSVPGFQEGLQLLQKNGVGKFYLPSHLAYGISPPSGIPSNAILIFEIELFDFF